MKLFLKLLMSPEKHKGYQLRAVTISHPSLSGNPNLCVGVRLFILAVLLTVL